MLTVIEIIAGQIIILLECTGSLTFDQVADNLEEPKELVAESLRWLIKEGYIIQTQEKYAIKYEDAAAMTVS